MEAWISPENGLAGVFAASFLASTVIPLSSEAVLFGFLHLYPDEFAAALALATIGNTLGGLTSYALGRLLPLRTQEKLNPGAIEKLKRYGSPLTFFAWLPVIGDALCIAAGWLRLNLMAVTAFMAAGRLLRYWLVAQGALM
jgi:membrane protein YqaA with SNARE-associated domain